MCSFCDFYDENAHEISRMHCMLRSWYSLTYTTIRARCVTTVTTTCAKVACLELAAGTAYKNASAKSHISDIIIYNMLGVYHELWKYIYYGAFQITVMKGIKIISLRPPPPIFLSTP